MVARGRGKVPQSADEIGVRVGKVIDRYEVGKHFRLEIGDRSFACGIDQEKVATEASLDGSCIIRTSLPDSRMSAEDAVRGHELLGGVERAFRSITTVDLKVRPIQPHLEGRVRAHVFPCMPAHHVAWRLLEAWRELLFSDEDTKAEHSRDPVAPARRPDAALRKAHDRMLDDETPVHGLRTLLAELGTVVRNTCRRKGADVDARAFAIATIPSPKQQRALDLAAANRA
jgi:hypothetical protein